MSDNKKYRLGVLVARFQTSMIHAAHAILINYVRNKNDRTLIVIGEAQTRLTKRNPLPAESRVQMIHDMYDTINDVRQGKERIVDAISLKDEKNDDVWSENLDNAIKHYIDLNYSRAGIINFTIGKDIEVTLYCGRDGFNQYYKGEFNVEEIDNLGIEHLSATEQRKQIHSRIKNSVEWREGVIYASAHKYPTSYQTVDIAIIKPTHHKTKITYEILLGRKKGESKYRFIGGFVDTKDVSLEMAAKREVGEECGLIETDNYKYIGSFRVDDWRYKNEDDSIMTALFTCEYIWGNPKASDDIEELKWFPLNEHPIPIESEHLPIMQKLINHLYK